MNFKITSLFTHFYFNFSQLKNSVIGSNRQKGNAVQQGVIPRLAQLLGDYEQPVGIRNETVVILCSLAKGTDAHVRELIKAEIVPLLLNCKLMFGSCYFYLDHVAIISNLSYLRSGILCTEDNKFSENCLRCICSIFKSSYAPVHLIFQDQSVVAHLLSLIMYSVSNQISITTIFSVSIKVSSVDY